MKFYIATRLENVAAHTRVARQLIAAGHVLTYDWSTHGAVFREGLSRIKEVAHREMQGVVQADIIVMLWPGGRGTHVELGLALALGKPVIIVSNEDGHHEPSPDTCAFYHADGVILVRTVEDAILTFENLARRNAEQLALAFTE